MTRNHSIGREVTAGRQDSPSEDRGSFGERLRDARLSAGLSQSELSHRSGLSKPTLSRYENDHVQPSLETLGRLTDTLGIASRTLFPGQGSSHIEEFCAELEARGLVIHSSSEARKLAGVVDDFLKSG